MNKVYKIIRNTLSGNAVVVSELAPVAAAVVMAFSGSAWAVDGLRASNASASYDDQNITTHTAKDYAAYASGANGALTLKGGALSTTGKGAYGAAVSDGAMFNLNNVSVTTQGGGGSAGLYAARNATLNATGVTVNAGSDDAVNALNQSTVSLNGGSVSGNRGLVAGGGSTITATGVAIHSVGDGILANGATVAGKQLAITTSGESGYGAASTGANSGLALSNSQISTDGKSAHGVYVVSGSTATSRDVDVQTHGDAAYGQYVNGVNSTLAVTGGSVTTTGSGSHGLVAGNQGTLNADNVTVNSTGYGVYANNATINARNIKVKTGVNGANGVESLDGRVTLADSQLSVSGENSRGLRAWQSGVVNGSHIDISLENGATGVLTAFAGVSNLENITLNGQQGGVALNVQSSSTLNATNLTANLSDTTGSAAENTGIIFDGYTTSVNAITLQNSSLTLSGANATGIKSIQGDSTLSLQDSAIEAKDGVAIRAINNTGLTVNLDRSALSGKTLLQSGNPNDAKAVVGRVSINASNQSQLSGDVNVNPAQTTDSAIALNSGSSWRGTAEGLHRLSLSDNSQWDLTQSGNVGSISLDNATINMTAPGTGYSELTVGDLTSHNGTIAFKTHLMDDSSQTDQLHITGDYTGNSAVTVRNAGGTGAKTLQGIQLIQVDGNVNGTFTQKGRIAAGAYDYFLKQENDGKTWSLNSDINQVDPDKGSETVDPAKKKLTPVSRPESGSYIANQAAANTLFTTTLEERLGETHYVDALGQQQVTSLWLRNEGGHNRFKDSSGQLKTTGNRYVMQLGGDVAQWSSNGENRFHLGVMAGYANAQSHTRSSVTGYGSKGQINGYSSGLYASWLQNNAQNTGAYLDSWALYNWFNNSVKGDNIGEENYRSKGITASLEGGYTVKLGELNARQSYYLRPQAQITWMGVEADDHTESNGTRIQSAGNNNVQTRLGLRAYINGHSLQDEGKGRTFEPFVEANWIHNTESFGSRLNGVSMQQAGARDIAELKVGVDAMLNQRVNLWGNIGQQIGDTGYSDSSAMLGVKANF